MGGKAKNKKYKAINNEEPPTANYDNPSLFNKTDVLLFLLLTAFSQAIYYLTMYPSLAGGDSGELMTVAVEFGVAHPPGYPLLTILGFIFNKLLPIGTPVWRLNTLATIIGGLSNGMIYLVVKNVTNNNPAAVLTALWCAFSRLHWTWSLHYEVFSLNNLLTGAILLSMVRFSRETTVAGMIRGAKVCAAMCGLAMSNQHTSILIIAPGAIWVLISLLRHSVTDFKVLASITLHGFAGLLLYLQFPLSAYIGTARQFWSHQTSVIDSLLSLKSHILREHYGTFKLQQADKEASFSYNLTHWLTKSSTDFTPILWVVAVLTALLSHKLVRPVRTVIRLFCAMLGVYIGVFCSLANLEEGAILERFWLQPNVLLVCIAGIGLGELFRRTEEVFTVEEKVQSRQVWTSFCTLLITLLVSWQIQRTFTVADQSSNYMYKSWADEIFKHAPNNSIILSRGDASVNSFWYHIFGENGRTDLCPIASDFIWEEWYSRGVLGRACPGVVIQNLPRKNLHYNWKSFFNDNFEKHTIIICEKNPVGIETSKPDYEIWPWGLCSIVVRTKDHKDLLHYFINDMPRVNLTATTFPSQSKYPKHFFYWEDRFILILITYIRAASDKLSSSAQYESDPSKQRLMIQTSKEYLEHYVTQVFLLSVPEEFVPGEKDHRMTLHNLLGQDCLILYTLSDGMDDKTLYDIEKCIRTNLKIFVDHMDQVAHNKVQQDDLDSVEKSKVFLSWEDFSRLRRES